MSRDELAAHTGAAVRMSLNRLNLAIRKIFGLTPRFTFDFKPADFTLNPI